jgi:undecaprenyl-diphosphatase
MTIYGSPPPPPAEPQPLPPRQPGMAPPPMASPAPGRQPGTVYRSTVPTGTNTMAILSVVFAFVFSPLGVVFGHVAKKQIRATRQAGAGLATVGLVIGYVGLGVWLIAASLADSGAGIPVWKAVVLGVVEGVTEFLPVSSTGHLTIVEKLLGLKVDNDAVTGFTAVIQVGAIFAAILYFFTDLARFTTGFVRGVLDRDKRGVDYRFGWYVIVGSVPIVIVGLAGKGIVKGPLRSLWVVAAALVLWSAVIVIAEAVGKKTRGEDQITMKDIVIISLAQCIALVPGVSRSGATISTGLLRNLDRVAATRLSFFLGIPALTAAGLYELKDALAGNTVGVPALAIGTLVSFGVAYASIAWLLKFVSGNSLVTFVWYRVAVGVVLFAALATHVLSAT